jgi:glycosyltransferase involved in cell wall biosynthesis
MDARQFDVVFLLDYAMAMNVGQPRPNRLVVSYNADTNRRDKWWPAIAEAADWVIVNNWDRYDHRNGVEHCTYIPNGYDHLLFRLVEPLTKRPDRVLWVGSDKLRKVKRYDSLVGPLRNALMAEGFECDFRLIPPQDKIHDMAAWYNSAGYVLCASASEGTPNYVTEAVACGCVAVSTVVGNIGDWGRDGFNCVMSQPTVASFVDAFCCARKHRFALAKEGMAAVWPWRYEVHASKYFDVFDQVLDAEQAGEKD